MAKIIFEVSSILKQTGLSLVRKILQYLILMNTLVLETY
jgi:hypothetical protein